MIRYIFTFLLLLIPPILSSQPVFSTEKTEGTLSAYLEQALTGNDSLRAARARLRAATAKTRHSGTLPDPKLTVQYYLQPIETRTGPQQASIGITQATSWFGKLSLL
jgi:outer membrane protein TolC